MNTSLIELVVSQHFNYRANLIVPNVSWGLLVGYEADLVVLRPSGYAVEVEIKTTASDIKADLKKNRHHDSRLFRELWFAVPEKLANHPDIPQRAGVLSVCVGKWEELSVKAIRRGKLNPRALRWSPERRLKLANLGCMRIWSLKRARWDYDRRWRGREDARREP